uniref:Glycosyltransferase n=1 Tax=Paeonia delavayi var. lutea TaxID=1967468 RepID=A0A2N9QL64_9MAGN|nr:THC 2'-glucosyltransferase [Paeonia lutea]
MKKSELVIIPAPGMGHLVSAVEFAKRLLNRDSQFSITVLVLKNPSQPRTEKYTKSLAASDTRVKYIDLPPATPPSPDLINRPEKFFSVYIENHKPHVKEAITNLTSCNSVPVGLVVDMFCTSMIDVANELGIPSYLFYASGAAFLGFVFNFPARFDLVGREYKKSDPESIVPSYINPIPTSVIPTFAFDKDGYDVFLEQGRRFRGVKGIIVNTFAELEPHPLNYFSSLSDQIPPVYAVGPLVELKGLNHSELDPCQYDKIMKWLDDQPSSSVVFLCFGSKGSFDEAQVREIALGLERSSHRFLWSIRLTSPNDNIDPREILPPGYLERIGPMGMVCEWAPQVEVLGHRSVGGFVSHCGWNSILESLWYGVPIVTWPVYGEQQINAFEMVRELKLAIEMKLDYRRGGDLVMADEIERAVRCLMDGGGEVRKRVEEMGEKCKMAVVDGGSSYVSFDRLIDYVLGKA